MTNRSKEQEKPEKEKTIDEESEQVTINEEDIEFVNEENSETVDSDTIGDVSEADAKVKKLKEEQEALQNRLLRVQADYENFKRRTNEDKIRDRKYSSQKLMEDIVPVLDNFRRGLDVKAESDESQGLKQGLEMVFRQLNDALKKEGVEEIEALGEPFDPNLHQAVMQVESDEHESNTVIEVLQAGYTLNERVIRPAMVKVNS